MKERAPRGKSALLEKVRDYAQSEFTERILAQEPEKALDKIVYLAELVLGERWACSSTAAPTFFHGPLWP